MSFNTRVSEHKATRRLGQSEKSVIAELTPTKAHHLIKCK